MSLNHEQSLFPADWPADGALDLARHDLPHGSSTTEWWYLNSHLVAPGGREFSVFAAFFRVATKVHSDGRTEYSNALTWGLSDVERREYVPYSFVDEKAPRIGLDRIKAGRGAKDERINRAVSEALEKNCVPLPDRKLPGRVRVSLESLNLDFGPGRLEKLENGSYRLFVSADDGPRGPIAIDLTFVSKKAPVRHGDDGVVRGVHGEDMFYVLRAPLRGEGQPHARRRADRGERAGLVRPRVRRASTSQRDGRGRATPGIVAWNWVSAQLDDGTDVSVYDLVRSDSKESQGRWAVLSGPTGSGRATLTSPSPPRALAQRAHLRALPHLVRPGDPRGGAAPRRWRRRSATRSSSRSSQARLLGRSLQGAAGRSRAGRCRAWAIVERSGFFSAETLDGFFKSVGEAVRESVEHGLPARAHPRARGAAGRGAGKRVGARRGRPEAARAHLDRADPRDHRSRRQGLALLRGAGLLRRGAAIRASSRSGSPSPSSCTSARSSSTTCRTSRRCAAAALPRT